MMGSFGREEVLSGEILIGSFVVSEIVAGDVALSVIEGLFSELTLLQLESKNAKIIARMVKMTIKQINRFIENLPCVKLNIFFIYHLNGCSDEFFIPQK